MGDSVEYLYENGTKVFSNFSILHNQPNVELLTFQTNNDDAVKIQKVMLRGCTKLSQLIELNLYINVSTNTPPAFISPIQTNFVLNVGDVFNYKLPFF